MSSFTDDGTGETVAMANKAVQAFFAPQLDLFRLVLHHVGEFLLDVLLVPKDNFTDYRFEFLKRLIIRRAAVANLKRDAENTEPDHRPIAPRTKHRNLR